MYINDVIRQVNTLYPSEYSSTEMYIWCDEVSSMLATEDRCSYRECTLPVMDDKTILLPEGVRIEHVEKVIANGRELQKADLRSSDNCRINADIQDCTSVKVIYLAPYEPIRRVWYSGAMAVDKENNTIRISHCEFISGDVLRIFYERTEFGGIYLMSVSEDPDNDTGYILNVEGDLSALPESAENVDIARYITETTVCDAPYDSMYIDYVLAKINQYQRDTSAYNQHMAAFNSKLYAYKTWLVNHMPQDDGKFKNWWGKSRH